MTEMMKDFANDNGQAIEVIYELCLRCKFDIDKIKTKIDDG